MIDQYCTQGELRDWLATNDFNRLQARLELGPDEFRYKFLMALLIEEMDGRIVTSYPRPPAT
jgi:hypothetical protein